MKTQRTLVSLLTVVVGAALFAACTPDQKQAAADEIVTKNQTMVDQAVQQSVDQLNQGFVRCTAPEVVGRYTSNTLPPACTTITPVCHNGGTSLATGDLSQCTLTATNASTVIKSQGAYGIMSGGFSIYAAVSSQLVEATRVALTPSQTPPGTTLDADITTAKVVEKVSVKLSVNAKFDDKLETISASAGVASSFDSTLDYCGHVKMPVRSCD